MNRKLFIERLALALARGRRSEDPPRCSISISTISRR
jgi:hypothetical protein